MAKYLSFYNSESRIKLSGFLPSMLCFIPKAICINLADKGNTKEKHKFIYVCEALK